jgi:hypothetical protein
LCRHERYRTYLYGLSAYRALFSAAGFQNARVLDLAPSYNDYDFILDARDGPSYRLLWGHGLMRSFLPGTGPLRRRLAAVHPALLGRLSYAYLVIGADGPLLIDLEHPIWTQLRGIGFDAGAGRFAADVTEPGTLAVLTHSQGRLDGAVFVSRRAHLDAPLDAMRSRRLAELLMGRLTLVGETAHADWRAVAFRIAQPR